MKIERTPLRGPLILGVSRQGGMAKHLHKGDETLRRWKIIDASRSGDASLLPQLLARLDGGETYENRRHIVRALGNIGGPRAEAKLLELLGSEHGLILGDIARALGELGCRRAALPLKSLHDHESEWVRQNVTFALRRLSDER
jgi:HEAT repeat protein